jgi:cytochrome c peroxidase
MVLSLAAVVGSAADSTGRHSKSPAASCSPVLSSDEQAGWTIFRGKGRCNSCHLDGTGARGAGRSSSGSDQLRPSDAADVAPLFTDFTSANIGVPRNPALRFYCENKSDAPGFIPNPAGSAYVDHGIAGFLRSKDNPNQSWTHLADVSGTMLARDSVIVR